MLDLSDKTLAPEAATTEAAANLPVIGLPEPGTLVRHHRGALYRIEGSSVSHESGEAFVHFRALDPLEADVVRTCPAATFFGPAFRDTPRFSRLRTVDSAKLRQFVPAEMVSDHGLEALLKPYDEPWRYFHTRAHIYAMFELAARRKMTLSPEQALAIVLHDVVYIPGAPEGVNERQSALLMHAMKRLVCKDVDWALTGRIIEDTAAHRASVPESVSVLDLDLSSLGDDPLNFTAANELVWLENRHLLPAVEARKDFDTRRLRFLLALAERGAIFSPAFADYEAAARENLERLRLDWVGRYGAEK